VCVIISSDKEEDLDQLGNLETITEILPVSIKIPKGTIGFYHLNHSRIIFVVCLGHIPLGFNAPTNRTQHISVETHRDNYNSHYNQ